MHPLSNSMKEYAPDSVSPINELRKKTVETMKELEVLGFSFDCSYAREISGLLSGEKQSQNYKSFWLEFKTLVDEQESCHLRAGKLFIPNNHNKELVCFYAGMPGENTADWEKHYVEELIDDGFAVWIPRHNGIKINEENQNYYINSQEVATDYLSVKRENVAERLSNQFLDDFLEEPAADLSVLTKQRNIDGITLIGHSFGASSIIHSLGNENPKYQIRKDVIKKVVLVNGLLGDGVFPEEGDEVIDGMRLTPNQFVNAQTKAASKFFNIDGQIEIKKTLQKLFPEIAQSKIPNYIDLIITASPMDAYLTLDGAKKYLENQGHGLLVADLTNSNIAPNKKNGHFVFGAEFEEITPELVAQANKESKELYGGSQHSAPNFKPETLLRLIKSKIIGTHQVSFSEKS